MTARQREYRPHNKMREIVADNNLLLMVISRFDIGFGFGDKTISEVCRSYNVDVDTFLAVCNLLNNQDYKRYPVKLPSLMGYLKRAHSSFVDMTLPKIRHKLIEAINYSDSNDVAFLLMKFYDDYVVEVKKHMDYENDTIFSYVDELLKGHIKDDFSITKFSVNHSHTATKLNELKDIFIYHYNQRDNLLLSSALFDIVMCERDMMSHFEVESKLFLPAVEALESTLRSRLANDERNEDAKADVTDSLLDSLSEREKDIIKCVARGLSNKEIADELCLSVHTITTHRRNLSAKLGIHSPAGLTIFAILHHLVEIKDITPRQ